MEIARIRVRQTTMELDQSAPVTRGMVGAAVVFEHFGPEWAGLSKTAVFRAGTASRDVANVQEDEPVVIPWEVLEAVLTDLQVGICGHNDDGTLIIPTVWGTLGKIAPGAAPVDRPSEPPTPDWTAQIEGQVNQALTEAQAVRPLVRQAAEAAAAASDHAASAGNAEQMAFRASQYSKYQARESKESAEAAGNAANLAAENAQSAINAKNSAVESADRAKASADTASGAADRAAADAQAASTAAGTAAAQADRAKQEANKAAEAAALSVSHGVAGAKKGDIFRIAEVDETGVPTSLEPMGIEALNGRWEIVKKTVIPDTGDITVVSATGLSDALEVGITFSNAGITRKDVPEMIVNTYFQGGGHCRFAFAKPFEYADSCGFMRVSDGIPEGTRGPNGKLWIDQISTCASSVFQNYRYETIEVSTHPHPMPKGLEIVCYAKRRR